MAKTPKIRMNRNAEQIVANMASDKLEQVDAQVRAQAVDQDVDAVVQIARSSFSPHLNHIDEAWLRGYAEAVVAGKPVKFRE